MSSLLLLCSSFFCSCLACLIRFSKGQSTTRSTRGFPRQTRYQHRIISTQTQIAKPVNRGFMFCKDLMISKKRCKHLHEDRHKGLPCTRPSSLVPICPAPPRVLTLRLRAVSQIRRVMNSLTAETRRMGFYQCALNTPHDNNSLHCSPYPEPYHEPEFLKIMRGSFLRSV